MLHAETFLSPYQPNGSITLSTQKGLDVNSWDGQLELSGIDGQGNSLKLNETIGVKLHSLQNYLPQWKIDRRLKLEALHPLNEHFEIIVTSEAGEFRDQFARHHPEIAVDLVTLPGQTPFRPSPALTPLADAQHLKDARLGTGGRWRNGSLSIEALIGILGDNRSGDNRTGLRGDFSATQVNDSLNWNVAGWVAKFPNGSDHDLRGDVFGEYEFGDEARDHFGVSYVNGRRFDIASLEANNTRRDDQQFNLQNQLQVGASESIDFVWDSEVNNQTAVRNTATTTRRDREFVWRNSAGMVWRMERLRTEVKGGIDVQQQKYAGSLTEGLRSSFGVDLARFILTSDSLNSNFSVLKYRYDTPEEKDHNDRDELRFVTGFSGSFRVTPTFSLRGGIGADLSHIVYISSDRSGENRWTRQFSLFAETPWSDPPITNVARFAIISHYTDYDFAPFDETASRVFRTATAIDTLGVEFGGGWRCELSLAGELNDHGSMVWDKWIQNVAEEGYAYTFATLPGYESDKVSFSAGWIFHRRESEVKGSSSSSIEGQSVKSNGPIAKLTLRPTSHFRLEASGATLDVRDNSRGNYSLPDIRLTLNWVI